MQNHSFTLILPLVCVAALLGLAGGALAESKIYRTVDEQGNVVFTDIAPRIDQPAETVELPSTNSFGVEESLGERQEWVVEGAGDAAAGDPNEASSYGSLVIVSPSNDATIRENTGNISIQARLTPEIRPGHRMRLLLDGAVASESAGGTFALQNVDRGTHSVVTEVLDQSGNVLIRSPATTFHLMRYAQPPPPPPKPAPRSG
ncbi:MAG: DUF4124 domain-containing protein [Pseudomonadales bacterium]|nr:DUF4124 domain-containing protein [Pseudomonadales bacterium]